MPRDRTSYKRENPHKGCENVGTKEQITGHAKTLQQRRNSVPILRSGGAFVLGTREIIRRKAVRFRYYKDYFWTLSLLDKISMILLKIEIIYLLRECNRNCSQSHRNTLNISGVDLFWKGKC